MNVTNCKTCGRLFNVLSTEKICPDCKRKLEDKFQEVKEYLTEYPNASVDEVSRENDVTVKQIKQWVREERLILSEGSMEGVECEKCGKLIRTGRFCEKCKAKISDNLMSALDHPVIKTPKPTEKERDRMRFL